MLSVRGRACFQCREHKVKCDALKPTCSRCERLHKHCTYAVDIQRRALIMGTVEARTLELELLVHKATLSSAHNLSLASSRLLERIDRLGQHQERKLEYSKWLPIYPRPQQHKPNIEDSSQNGQVMGEDVTEGYSSVISRHTVEDELISYEWTGADTLPPLISDRLIRLFLPYRSQFYFFMDVPYFLDRLSLPPSHPGSIHPCLLHACYLAACESSGGVLASLQPFFVQRTRHFLDQSLMHADRITHFLWASVILGCNLSRRRRLDEAYAVLSSASLLLSASGRTEVDSPLTERLLPPPKDELEAIDGIRLAYSVYLANQTLSVLAGFPGTFQYDDKWALPSSQREIVRNGSSKTSSLGQEKLEELWSSDIHLKMLIVRIVERVVKFALAYSANGYRGMEAEYIVLGNEIRSQQKSIPPLSDPRGLRAEEAVSTFNPHILHAHSSLYGSGLILWGLRAHEDAAAKQGLLECLHSLAAICELIGTHRRLGRVHAPMTAMAPMRNAIRVLASQMRSSEFRGNPALSSNYLSIMEILLDFLDDMTLRYTEWGDATITLKETLIATANHLAS
ncbi:hypothetical protein DL93DRAFT_1684808 [Clavulina sp. PMI_390]|nr:hypothetical protein DL93DRAFT_1684808 [Clavulina sp. PMI_390]